MEGSLSHYLQGFIHPRWCKISAINSMTILENNHFLDSADSLSLLFLEFVVFVQSFTFILSSKAHPKRLLTQLS